MCQKLLTLILVVVFVFQNCENARILGFIPTPSFSHQQVYRPIWRELSLKGHQVVVITTNPMGNKSLTNLTEIDLSSTYDLPINSDLYDSSADNDYFSSSIIIYYFHMAMNYFISAQMKHHEVQKLINDKSQHFDLVMVEYFVPFLAVFGERFNCPVIGMTSMEAPFWSYQSVGSPTHPVLNPIGHFPVAFDMSLTERILTTLSLVYEHYFLKVYGYPTDEKLIRKHFGNHYPTMQEILNRRVSMLFVNLSPLFKSVRSTVPTVVTIGGGTHLRASKPLPKDLDDFLNDSLNGFIYCSFGTNVKSKYLSNKTRDVILEVFSQLPYDVLWKYDGDIPNTAANIKIRHWFPQQDVLRHKNVKLFITQGGMQSLEEALYALVPLVLIPFVYDQRANSQKAVAKGFGLRLEHKTLNTRDLKNSILQVVNNSDNYRNNIKAAMKMASDEPMSGLENAIWWTEYVIRHKGAKHLRSPLLDIPFYQYHFLDVVAVFLCIFIFSLMIVSYTIMKSTRIVLTVITRYVAYNNKIKVV